MNYFFALRDFVLELLTPKTSLRYKKMRLLARFPRNRQKFIEKLKPACGFNPNYNDGSSTWLQLEDDYNDILNNLRKSGFSGGIKLSTAALSGLREFCDQQRFIADRNSIESFPILFSDKKAPCSSSIYSLLDPHLSSIIVNDLTVNSKLTQIAMDYLGAPPVLMNTQIWYTFPNDSQVGHHNFGFHYDVDDYKFIKFFFYLDKVDDERGPHIIISNTHNEGSLFKYFNRRLSDEIAQSRYNENIIKMVGSAGVGFAEDTFCYHKGLHPIKRRLLLQIQYGVNEKDFFE